MIRILNADKLLAFPDFRSTERAFQLMTQVSGRAGRRNKRGKVIVQTFSPTLPIFTDVINTDYNGFFKREFEERRKTVFPPIVRAIEITIKHKKDHIAKEAGELYREFLHKEIGQRVSSLFTPSIPRLRNYYIQKLFIKMEKDKDVNTTVKRWVQYYRLHLLNSKGFKSVRINVDVDPY
jgi:primosomal protein N' (replication factor Y)